MSSSEKKRKRVAEGGADDVKEPATKVQILEDGSSKASDVVPKRKEKVSKAGERRQIRSERKSKRALEAKANALKKKEKRATETFKASTNGEDDLAKGQDFVSLDGSAKPPIARAAPAPGPTPASATLPFQRREGKVKKSSPRSIRKREREAKIANALTEAGLVDPSTGPNAVGSGAGKAAARFIVFVGNLPYDVTNEQIEQHFSKLKPKSIRNMTDKDTGKSKGFAFLEFDHYDKMKDCLKNYHHSIFDPEHAARTDGEVKQAVGRHRKMRGRKLNVELTAGGGGKSNSREKKIREKNKKLEQERLKEKLKKRKEQSKEAKKKTHAKKDEESASGANAFSIDGMADRGDIHPSRLSRVTA